MSKKIITTASRNGKTIIVKWVMKNDIEEIIDNGEMVVDLINIDALDYSQSPPVLMTQEQRIQLVVSQVQENLKRMLSLQDAGETDGDEAIKALDGMEVVL